MASKRKQKKYIRRLQAEVERLQLRVEDVEIERNAAARAVDAYLDYARSITEVEAAERKVEEAKHARDDKRRTVIAGSCHIFRIHERDWGDER